MARLLLSFFRTPASTVAGSFLVMVVGVGPVVFVAFSLFMPAIAQDFGWSRSSLSLGIFIYTITNALATPLLGRLIDGYGIRKPTTLAIIFFCATLAAAALMPRSTMAFLLIYALLGFFGASLTPMPYAKAVSDLFDRHRGIALGISMAGYGIGAALISLVVSVLITAMGWRSTYFILALTVLTLSLFSVWFLIAENCPSLKKVETNGIKPAGLSVKASLTDSHNFWLIAVALLLISIAINGLVTHFISLTKDRGISTITGGYLLTTLGISSILGRLLTGYLIDRFFAPKVSCILFFLPLLGIIFLALDLPDELLVFSAITLGIGLGAEVDVMGYVVGRYFGIRSFAEIYGYLLATFSFGAGAGSFFFGAIYDFQQSYTPALWTAASAILMAIFLFNRLGVYRFPVRHSD